MDLIDRQAAINVLATMQGLCTSKTALVQNSKIWQQIKDLPSADVQPVRHGKWIDMADFEQCSSCSGTRLKEMQTVYGKAIWIKTPYCPNCGARMDEVE